MRNLQQAALAGAAILTASVAQAAPPTFGPNPSVEARAAVIQVHSRKQVHDQLHDYGYDNVVYLSRDYGDSDKPNYKFRACQGRRAFVLHVNWYGHIIDQRPAGRCDGYDDDRRAERYRERRDW